MVILVGASGSGNVAVIWKSKVRIVGRRFKAKVFVSFSFFFFVYT